MLAKLHSAKTLLGSATPSIETYCNCLTNKYGLVQMTQPTKLLNYRKLLLWTYGKPTVKNAWKVIF